MTHQLITYRNRLSLCCLTGSILFLGGCQAVSTSPESIETAPVLQGVPVEVQSMMHPIEESSTSFVLKTRPATDESERDQWISQLSSSEEGSKLKDFLQEMDDSLLVYLAQMEDAFNPQLLEANKNCSFNHLLIETLGDASQPSLYHQIGHLIDQQLGGKSQEGHFKTYYQEGVNLLFPNSSHIQIENESEYFAQAFQLFFKDPAQLLKHEETYKYFCSLMEQLQLH